MEHLNDPVLLSRLQFALTAVFHIVWPVLTIGLSLFLVAVEALWLKTGETRCDHHARCPGTMRVRALGRGSEDAPFVWRLVIFLASFVGLAASLYPCLIPPLLTIDDAAPSGTTLVFMLAGIGMPIPFMRVYNGCQYLVFRGRISPGAQAALRHPGSPAGADQPSIMRMSRLSGKRLTGPGEN